MSGGSGGGGVGVVDDVVVVGTGRQRDGLGLVTGHRRVAGTARTVHDGWLAGWVDGGRAGRVASSSAAANTTVCEMRDERKLLS